MTVIIPTWNGREHLAHCLPLLASQTCPPFEIVVVDNGSTDGTVEWLETVYPAVRLVSLNRNYGFAAACNAGIRVTGASFIITLNNDTRPRPDFVAALLEAATQHPDVDTFAATLWLDTQPPVADAAGIGVDRLGVAWNVARTTPPDVLPRDVREVFGPCAGAALYRREVLEDIGLFDERYFAYLEDVELAWRAQWAGRHCLWVPDATVLHAHSATGRRNPAYKYWLLGRNRLWTILRHYPRPHLWYYLPLILINELASGLLGTLALRHPAPLAGRLEALRRWRTALDAPQRIPRRRSPQEIFDRLTPLASPTTIWARYRRGNGIPFEHLRKL